MDLGDLSDLASSSDNVEGIYNYCDRWCERCPMTARCLLFQTEQAQQRTPGDNDAANAAFWNRLAETLRNSLEMLKRACEERGLDIEALRDYVVGDVTEESFKKLESEPLPKMAHQYAELVNHWFESASPDFAAKGEELRSIDRMQLEGEDPEADALDIQDCVEVIRWYQYQIAVKVMRAYSSATDSMMDQGELTDELKQLRSKLKDNPDISAGIDDLLIDGLSDDDDSDDAAIADDPFPDDDDPFDEVATDDEEFEAALREAEQSDANGSAKVALIAIDRSIAAWTKLRLHLPDRADEMLDQLVLLTRLRRDVEAQFPEARAFIRPGFDDE